MSRLLDLLGGYVTWLSDSFRADARYLAAIRIAFGAYLLLLPLDYTWPARVPESFFRPPPGPFRLLSETPPLEVLLGIQVAVAVLAALLVLGYRTVLVSVLLSVAMILGSGITYSFGKVDHQELVELLPLAMAAAGWGRAWSLDRRLGRVGSSTSGFAILLWAVVVGFAMLTAVLPKVANGWLDPSRHATRGYVGEYALNGQETLLGDFLLGIDSAVLWKFLDYSTVAVEGGLLVAVLFPPLFRLVLLALVGFHVGVFLSLGISFHSHAFVYAPFLYAVWVGAAAVLPARRRREGPEREKTAASGRTGGEPRSSAEAV